MRNKVPAGAAVILLGVLFFAFPVKAYTPEANIEGTEISVEETTRSEETRAPETTAAAAETITEEIIHNEEQLDINTGDPVSEDNQKDETVIRINAALTYDTQRRLYTQSYGNGGGQYVTSNVASGMITNDAVKVKLGDGLTGVVFVNGIEQSNPDLTQCRAPGNYAVRLYSVSGEDLGTFRFRIVGNKSNISGHTLPESFSVVSSVWEGYSMWSSDRTISFEDEGQYYVVYRNDVTGVSYSVTVTIDHTAPVLALKEVDENNTARSAVDISDQEPDSTLVVLRDGAEVKTNGRISTPGAYQLTLKDEAGNVTAYAFTIYMYFSMSSIFVIAILVLAQIGLIGYLIVSRKNMRVR